MSDDLLFEEFRHMGCTTPSAQDPVSQHRTEMMQRAAEQQVIHRVLLRQMAVQEGLQVTDADIEAERRRRWGSSSNEICGTGIRESIRTQLLITRVCESVTRHVMRPSRAEVEQFYRANPQRFYQPERVHAAHIVRNVDRPEDEGNARATLEAAEAELAAGKPFAKVANRYSDCGGVGGSLGWITRGEMVDEFDDVVFALKRGERSPIFRTVFGLHIATALEKKQAGVEPLEEIRHSLALSLLEGRRQSEVDRILAQVMRRAQIQEAPEGLIGSPSAKENGI